jgi:hypothetical protein
LAPGRRGKKNDRGKESVQKTEVTTGKRTTCACKKACTKESDSWRKNNTRMGERPNVRRVRVLVIFCKRLKSPKCINIDTKVSYRDVVIVMVVVIIVVVEG